MLSTKKRFGGKGGNDSTKRRHKGGLSLKQKAKTHRWQLRRQAKMKARKRSQTGNKATEE